MSSHFKISIPEPCSEDWNKMIPNESGRFCEHCSKTVIDFTAMPPDEIKHFFLENRGKNICGRIKQSQLDRIVIQIPSRVLYSQTQYQNYFLLALFVVMGTTLFSCADKNGNKQKIDKIEVVEDSPKNNDSIIEGNSIKNENKTNTKKPVSIKKQTKYYETLGGVAIEVFPETIEDNAIYGGMGIDTNPEFAGGEQKFYTFIKQNYKFSKKNKGVNYEITSSFFVEKDGSVTTVQFKKNSTSDYENELKRILLLSPKWNPGEVHGKKVRTKYEIRLTISPEKIKRKFWFNKTISKIDSIQIKPTDWDSIQKAIEELDQKSPINSI